MVEKHLNRISEEEKAAGGHSKDSDDEWAHITGVGSKIEAIDPLAVTDRSIIFGKDIIPSTKEESVKEKTDQFKDQMGNTTQYLKFVNAHLTAKMEKIDKIKEQEKKFKEEIESLQGNNIKPRSELDKINYKHITENDTKSLFTHMESELGQIKEKLTHQESQVEKTKSELQQKEEQLKHLQEEIVQKNKIKTTTPVEDPVAIIREELAKLGIVDSGKIENALSALSNRASPKYQSQAQMTALQSNDQ
jgi:chromosome segregation ATPase